MPETTPAGQRVIVTGATGGIGRAIVGALGRSGGIVAACDVPGARLGDVFGAAVTAEFDVRDRAAVDAGVGEAIGALGGCDAVIANAGIVDTIHRADASPTRTGAEISRRICMAPSTSPRRHSLRSRPHATAASW